MVEIITHCFLQKLMSNYGLFFFFFFKGGYDSFLGDLVRRFNMTIAAVK